MPRILTKIDKPTYTTLKQFEDKLIENAMSIPSYDNNLGHLALVITETKFTAANGGQTFTTPEDPGRSPPMPAFASTTPPVVATAAAGTRAATAAINAAKDNFRTAEAIRSYQHSQTESQNSALRERPSRTASSMQSTIATL